MSQTQQKTFSLLGLTTLLALLLGLLVIYSPGKVQAHHASDCSDVYTPLSQFVVDGVNNNRSFYESAMNETGVPWEMLAAIHYRETNFSHNNPSNGQGIFQFVNGEGGPYPPGPVNDTEFYRQLKFMANKIQDDYVWRNSPNPASVSTRRLTAGEQNVALIKNTLYSYNGRASVYANQADHFGFDKAYIPYEGSPYVVNRFDCARARMGIITQDYGGMDGTDTRYGTFTIFARLRGESFWFGLQRMHYAIAVGQSNTVYVKQGKVASVYMRFQNLGAATWYDDIGAPGSGQLPTKLGTDHPLNRSSPFGKNWPAHHRPANTFGRVYNPNGSLASNQHKATPGQIVEFWFAFNTSFSTKPGTYVEAFRPIVEGGSPMNNTGSYLLVNVIERDYRAQAVNQSAHPTVKQGKRTNGYLSYKNVGNDAWYDEISAWSAGELPVRLGTDVPANRASAFGSKWKFGPSRAAESFAAVYEANGTTLASNQHVVQPGQIARFVFDFYAPLNLKTGYYAEGFRPLVEGWGPMNNTGTWLGVTVEKATYTAQPAGQSGYPTMKQGQEAESFLRYKNTGNVAWYDEISAWSAGELPVRLGTDVPANRASAFGSKWKFGPSRAAESFAAVYEANGTTLASNQHVVQPGQIAEFKFKLKSTLKTQPGTYAEGFRPLVEGWGPMNNTGTWLGVTVEKATYTAQPAGQSNYPTVRRGSESQVHMDYKNTGNVAWYDEISAWSAGELPVRLGTDVPANRASAFGSKWKFGPSRAAESFAAVYEANGTTLASNQHVVQPGQIARFVFDFYAPLNLKTGYYAEGFRPLVEGWGPMNNTGTWLGVTVEP